MTNDDISNVLLVSFDQSQGDDVKILRGVIEQEHDVKVMDFTDIQHLYQKQPSYAKKLKKMLDRTKLTLLVTPNDVDVIGDERKLTNAMKSLYSSLLDDESSKIFLEFLKIERDEDTSTSKLVFITLRDGLALPEVFGNTEHVTNMFVVGDNENEGGGNVDESQVKKLLTKVKRSERATFPKGKDESGNTKTKNKDCMLM